jgi:tRNA U34 2-thiouridine synthase MnmA/TrmU
VTKAIGCISGGLDSSLAVCLVREQGIDVECLHVLHIWHPEPVEGEEKGHAVRFAESRGIPVHLVDAAEADLEMVRRPEHGFGKRMNPCIDCRIWTLRRARELMDERGADFLFTGEVMGQRPMSQHRGALKQVEREAGVEDRLVRPLSAKLLPPTRPEREGLIDRDRLLDIQGRSRKRQMELAERFGITDYPSPAGGCLLTDPGFAYRLRELMDHETPTVEEVELLKLGRHFRLPDGSRAVVGRRHEENLRLEKLLREGDVRFEAAEMPGPTTLLRGPAGEESVVLAAGLTLRYGKAGPGEVHPVRARTVGDGERVLEAAAADEETCRRYIISPENEG